LASGRAVPGILPPEGGIMTQKGFFFTFFYFFFKKTGFFDFFALYLYISVFNKKIDPARGGGYDIGLLLKRTLGQWLSCKIKLPPGLALTQGNSNPPR
jgi:hypothetical protein